MGFRWHRRPAKYTTYAIANLKRDGRWTSVEMQRLLMDWPAGLVDHKNRNGLDNRRRNLRLATKSQNNANNQGSRHLGRFKGVYLRSSGMWKVTATFRGEGVYLGQFDNEVEAAKVYDAWAREAHGEFASLNFPDAGDGDASR